MSKSKEKIREFREILRKSRDEKERLAAVKGLGKMKEAAAEALPELIRIIKRDRSYTVQSQAEETVVKIGKKAIPALFAFLKSWNGKRRSKGAYLLGEIAKKEPKALPDIMPGLLRFVERELRYWVRCSTIEVIGGILKKRKDIPEAYVTLGNLMRERNIMVRRAARDALLGVENERAVLEFMKAIDRKNYPIFFRALYSNARYEAASDLLNFDMKMLREEIPILIKTLKKDRNPAVRIAMVSVLGLIGGPEAVDAILETIVHDRWYLVRVSAIDTFTTLHSNISKKDAKKAMAVLKKVSHEEKLEYVRDSARRALEELEEKLNED